MTRAAERVGQSGIVLVEMLATLSIVALMSGLMLGYVGQLRALVRVQQDVAERTELAAAAGHVRLSLEAARALPLNSPDPASRLVFEGGANGMRFVAVARREDGSLGLSEVRLTAVATGGTSGLIQSIHARRATGVAVVASETVIANLSGLRFAYADADGNFKDTWAGITLPRAVRVRLARSAGDRAVSVEDVARLP